MNDEVEDKDNLCI